MMQPEQGARKLLQDFGCRQPPVPVDDIAMSLGIRITSEEFEGDVSGLLLRDESSVAIGVNGSQSPSRQRFTIAHELGHYLLHAGRPLIVDQSVRVDLRNETSSLATDAEEIQANGFAAELLMPSDFVFDELGTGKWTDDDTMLDELALTFEVSKQAMQYRLINLGLRSPD